MRTATMKFGTVPGRNLGNILDTLKNIISTGTDVYNQNSDLLDPLRDQAVANAVSNATGTSSPSSPATYPAGGSAQAVPPVQTGSSMSTGTKVAIGVARVALVGGIMYAVLRKKSKKS